MTEGVRAVLGGVALLLVVFIIGASALLWALQCGAWAVVL